MMYSIIICYRDRAEHLKITVPRLKYLFDLAGTDYEIIVVEQADAKKFRRSNLFNVGALKATGDVLIFHDVDHYPTETVDYWDDSADVILPIRFTTFVYNSLKPKPMDEVPGGYRHFKDGVDDNFYGGVEIFKRAAFFKINGFNPLFVGWGFEDADLRERVQHYGLSVKRGDGQFLALDHPDSGPDPYDWDFQHNIVRATQWRSFLHAGVNNMPFECKEVVPKHPGVDMWLEATDFDPPPASRITYSDFNFDSDD